MLLQGSISATGVGVCNNTTGVASGASGAFPLDRSAKSFYLQSNTTGVQWEMFAGASDGCSFATTAARGAFLAGPNQLNGPYMAVNHPVISVINAGSGVAIVRIYASPTS